MFFCKFISAILLYIEDRLTFKPNPDYDPGRIPADCQIQQIEVAGISITIAYKIVDPTLICINCHGNTSNISNLPGIYEFYNQTGYSYLMFDYPGYGASTGRPSEENLYLALNAVVDFVQSELKFAPSQQVLHGISLGGAVAIDGLTRFPVLCGVIDSTISNNVDMAKFLYPYLPLWRFLQHKFYSSDKVQRIQTPILFFHGDADTVVPSYMSQILYEAKVGPKELLILPGVKHVDPIKVESPEIIQKFVSFIEKYRSA